MDENNSTSWLQFGLIMNEVVISLVILNKTEVFYTLKNVF